MKAQQFQPDLDAYKSNGSSPPRLIRLKGRWGFNKRHPVEVIWVNPEDVSVLRESAEANETFVVLRSMRTASPSGFWVSAPIDKVAERINGGAQ